MAKNTLFVKSKLPNGFRRAGLAFDRNGVDVDPRELTEAQLDAILNEPNLIVVGAEAESADGRAKREFAEKAAAEKAAAEKAAAEKAATAKVAAEKAAKGKGAK